VSGLKPSSVGRLGYFSHFVATFCKKSHSEVEETGIILLSRVWFFAPELPQIGQTEVYASPICSQESSAGAQLPPLSRWP
jgi:hypothetical protein